MAGILLGLGLGGFFDGIVLHQVLQWHHMVTSVGYPPDRFENIRINVFADGLFHAATFGIALAGSHAALGSSGAKCSISPEATVPTRWP